MLQGGNVFGTCKVALLLLVLLTWIIFCADIVTSSPAKVEKNKLLMALHTHARLRWRLLNSGGCSWALQRNNEAGWSPVERRPVGIGFQLHCGIMNNARILFWVRYPFQGIFRNLSLYHGGMTQLFNITSRILSWLWGWMVAEKRMWFFQIDYNMLTTSKHLLQLWSLNKSMSLRGGFGFWNV